VALNRRVVDKAAGLVFVLFIASSCFGYNWAFKEGGAQTVEQRIRQTVGAKRGEGTRFHRGIDVCPNDPANIAVYAVNSGTAHWYNENRIDEQIVIGDIRYIHIRKELGTVLGILAKPPLQSGPNGCPHSVNLL